MHGVRWKFLGFGIVVAVACGQPGNTGGRKGTAGGTGGAGGSTSTGGSGGPAGTGGGGGTGDTGGTSGTAGPGGTSGAGAGGQTGGSGGSGEPDSGMTMGGADAAVGQDGGHASNIDYSIWVLQLPTGGGNSPASISSSQLSSGYSSAYFYKAPDGGQVFMDPATGTTTPGSQHCRTEMRESAPGGGGPAGWSSSGTNSLTVTGKVLKVGGGNITVGQLFNVSDEIPLCELEYTTGGGFQMLYEESKGNGTSTNLNTPVPLNSMYTYTLALTKGVLTVTLNGKVVHTQTPSAGALGKKYYFKFGDYDQSSSSGAESTTVHSLVEVYSVDVVHAP
jgi:hypothetical protein